jgi:hypothetical protein
MAENERDPDISRRYRDLGREEPPRHLDDAILAASRRDVRRKPWLYPVAAAAAAGVLAVAVSLHVERQPPEEVASYEPSVAAKPEEPAKPAAEEPAKPAPEVLARPAPPPAASRGERRAEKAPAPVFVPDPKPSAEKPSADAAGPGVLADRRDDTRDLAKQSGAGSATAEQAPAARARAAEPQRPLAALQLDEAPLPWLERIAKLRQEGKHEDADRALAEFRKRYPDFKIPEAMLGRVERK